VADAITICPTVGRTRTAQTRWARRTASSTTVNGRLSDRVVETTLGHYSGGMENFPRFLETWGSANVFTYNGSMVKMFRASMPPMFGTGKVYDPPARNWAYDANFGDPTKLPLRRRVC